MSDLNEIQVFSQVVRSGSFTAAGRALGLPKSTVSRKVAALEERLGVALLQRTTRKLNLTDVGDQYFRSCSKVLAELEEAESIARSAQAEPRGLLRVTAPVDIGTSFLGELVQDFLRKHEEVQVELLLTDRIVDLIEEGVDLAIRAGDLADSSLIARKIGTHEFGLVAAPSYLRKNGSPANPRELARHECLRFTAFESGDDWELVSGKSRVEIKVGGRVSANNLESLRYFAIEGSGIALLPAFMCREGLRAGRLVRVLPEWASERSPVFVVYPNRRFVPPKLKLFIDHLTQAFARRLGAKD